MWSRPAQAQRAGGGPPIVRDAEIEQLLREYTQPILKAAGLAQQNIQVVIINSRAFNAFVADGRRIFINAGTLMEAETPNQVIGVLAHETGHIAGGHLSRLREELRLATTASIIAHDPRRRRHGRRLALRQRQHRQRRHGGAVGAAGDRSRIRCLAYVRTQEDAADRAGVRFLNATGQSARGMSETFKRLADQILYASQGIDPYMQSHPLPAERVRALEGMAKASPHWDKKDSPALQARHDLARAKLYGFLDPRDGVARRYPISDNSLAGALRARHRGVSLRQRAGRDRSRSTR